MTWDWSYGAACIVSAIMGFLLGAVYGFGVTEYYNLSPNDLTPMFFWAFIGALVGSGFITFVECYNWNDERRWVRRRRREVRFDL